MAKACKRKRVLVTGAAGMIGSHLCDSLLAYGYKVIGIDNLSNGRIENIFQNLNNSNFIFQKIDILNYKELEKACAGVDVKVIVHLAASKKIAEDGNSLGVLTNNVRGTENSLRLAKRVKGKFILGSTSDVYGASCDIPFRENGNLLLGSTTAKRWSYAVSKIYSEQLAFAYYKEQNVPIVILRYFGAFSPRASFDWKSGHIPIFIDAVLNDREIIIHGDGTQSRSMGYISDVVDGTILTIENSKAIGHIFNIGNDEEMSVLDTAYLIKKLAGINRKLKIKFIPFKKIFGDYCEIKRRVPDLTKARKILGYLPKVNLEEGLLRTIQSRKEWLKKKRIVKNCKF